MKHLTALYEHLCNEYEQHKKEIFNYTIPESWDIYGYPKKISTKEKEFIVNPYEFSIFTLQHMMSSSAIEVKKQDWYKQSVLYYQITRLSTAWDHDRTSSIDHDNLYHLNEQGTFLKAMLRLGFYQRMGINTILLASPLALGTSKQHAFANPNAIASFSLLDPTLRDPLVGDVSIEEQYLAFEECAHHLGFHIIWQIDFTTLARDNVYCKDHPDWFYWIKKEHLHDVHAPIISYLTQNSLPEKELKDMMEQSADYKLQQAFYVDFPTKKTVRLNTEKITCVPFQHDRINSTLPIELDYTPLRFYKDYTVSSPITLRCDRYPGKQKNTSLWKMITTSLQQLQTNYTIDGFYFTRPYLYPQELLQSLQKLVKDQQQVVLLEEENISSTPYCDGIRGNSAYLEHDVWNYSLQQFAYSLKDNPVRVFAGAEFCDTLRITQHQSFPLTTLLHVLNLFLPNANPFYMSGMECMEQQPLLLSYFQDQINKNALSDQDPRYQKQPLLDSFYFEYRSDGMYMLPKLLERVSQIRKTYIEAISNPEQCTHLWFHSPNDPGIGFGYHLASSTLLVIANTNVQDAQSLTIHMDNVLSKQSTPYEHIHQIYSTDDPFLYDIDMNPSHVITLPFQPGEVKFLELTYTTQTKDVHD